MKTTTVNLTDIQLEQIFKSFMYVLNQEKIEIDPKFSELHDAMLTNSPYSHDACDLEDNLEVLYQHFTTETTYLEDYLDFEGEGETN